MKVRPYDFTDNKGFQVWHRIVSLMIMIAFLSGACANPTPPPMPPDEIVSRMVDRMESLEGFHFVIDLSGAPVFLDYEGLLAFSRAEGDFVAPDKAQATVRVIGPGVIAEVKTISIGEVQWQTDVVTGAWFELPPEWSFNPAALFDPKIGIQPILEADLSDLELIGTEALEEVPDHLLYALKGTADGEKLNQMSFGMMGPEPMEVRLWIAPTSFELYRILIIDPSSEDAEPTIWQVDFWNFGQSIQIAPPLLDGGTS